MVDDKELHGGTPFALIASLALAFGCTANITGTGSGLADRAGGALPGGGSAAGGSSAGGAAQTPAATGVGPTGLRRLTRREYDNTIAELLGDEGHAGQELIAETRVAEGYVPFQPVGVAELEQYRAAAESIAARAVEHLATLVPCDNGADELSCTRSFIGSFGMRAFRRPLSEAESRALESLYSGVRTRQKLSHADGVRVLIGAVLQDPRFLYQRQVGTGLPDVGGLVALDPYDMAARLSYALWRTMPDAELFAAAGAGHLSMESEVREQASRMLADPRAREATTAWVTAWLGLERLDDLSRPSDVYPEWSAALARAMRAESEAFVASVVLDGDARLETLLTAPVAFADAALSRLYGVSPPSASGASEVALDATRRAGILTQASFLTAFPTPVLRGKFIRERLFCQTIPPPPPNAQGMGNVLEGAATERERMMAHSTDPACAGCHKLMDPPGFALLSFDAIGRSRDADGGRPIDDSGSLSGTDVDGAFEGPLELAGRLATSADVRQCLTRRWFRSLLERPETEADTASLDASTLALNQGDEPLRDMLLAVVTSAAFRYRRPLPGESTP